MENFIISNPTSLHFGRNVIAGLPEVMKNFGKRVLLVCGKNSVKANGIYDEVMRQLQLSGASVFEYSGIKSNPVISDVDAAAELGRKNNVDLIVALGGGSVIDSAKIIALAIPIKNKAWDLFEYKVKPTAAVPLIAILTLAATGTEMNAFAVVQNDETKQKPGYYSPYIFPRHSFLDPAYTLSVPANYTAYGITDLVAHSLEGYFGVGETTLTDKFIFSIIREAIEFGPQLMDDLQNYSYREKIMFAATCALNGTTAFGKKSGDWGVHGLGHALSMLWDVPHGASLSIMYPAWMKYFKEQIEPSLLLLGNNVFGVDTADETISCFEQFFRQIGSPVRMHEVGLSNIPDEKEIEMIIENLLVNKVSGAHYKMGAEDYRQILINAY
ncbi:MAG: iron-containing alcohol dehydrogenase [Bacteroidota bacterium]